jgi:integrase
MTARGVKATTKKGRKPWSGTVGHEPHLVWYGERPEKNYRVYLRWRVPTPEGDRRTNWKWRSLKLSVRDADGVRVPEHVARVVAAATDLFRVLSGETRETKTTKAALTLRDTWPVLSASDMGSFPTKTPYRDEIERALQFARKVLGDGFLWVDLDYEQLQKVVRAKADEVFAEGKSAGLRSAEVVGVRLLTMAGVLQRKHNKIPPHAPIPSGRGWRDDLQRYVAAKHGGDVPTPERPRHSLDEVRRILRAAASVDPRVDLVLALGAEYRSGQVVRAMRSQLDLQAETLEVRGRGKKRGTTVVLTAGQLVSVRRALDGYLRQLERAYVNGEIDDYPLFPAGRLRKGEAYVLRHASAPPIHKRSMNERFHAVERAAKVEPLPGRAFYGVRRALLDAAAEAGISDEAMQEHGGWSNSRTPRDIYRDRERKGAQRDAAKTRAEIRGEVLPDESGDHAAETASASPAP